ncbi:hypothetical protein VE00_00910 [Pseudogymnoascus sp. WSF 3629]|nr:hypothetical protein VE00_00910 [Pseudogymnoascus sp. WSF 3629]
MACQPLHFRFVSLANVELSLDIDAIQNSDFHLQCMPASRIRNTPLPLIFLWYQVKYQGKSAEVDAKDTEYGQTPLSWAAGNGLEAVAKLLLDKGAEVDAKDTEYGRTPLSLAAENGHEAVVQLLLEKGVEVDTKDGSGQTPLSWATEKGHEVVEKLLLRRGALLVEDLYGLVALFAL